MFILSCENLFNNENFMTEMLDKLKIFYDEIFCNVQYSQGKCIGENNAYNISYPWFVPLFVRMLYAFKSQLDLSFQD